MDGHRRLEGDADADAQFAGDVSLRGPSAPDLFAAASAASAPASRRDLALPKAQSTAANLANGKGTKRREALKQGGCVCQASLVASGGERTVVAPYFCFIQVNQTATPRNTSVNTPMVLITVRNESWN